MIIAPIETRIRRASLRAPSGLDFVEPNLTLWRRAERYAFRPLLRYYAEAEATGDIGDELIATILDSARCGIGKELPSVPYYLTAARHAFAADMRRLIELYAVLTDATAVRVKLEVERGDRCRYFHTDRIGLRLLCTYLGTGTEWVPDAFADRSALCGGDNAAIVPDPRHVNHLAPFWVGFFKGDLHRDCPGRGCIHRSPPIERRRNAARILLTIDDPVEND